VRTIRRHRPRLELHADDPSLTPAAGLVVVAEAVRALGVVSAIDQQVGPIKRRRRGLGPGQLLVGLAETLLAGGDFLIDLDHQRADRAGSLLRSLPPPPSTTTASLARRFGDPQVAGIERAMAGLVARALALLGARQRRTLLGTRPTIDLDPTEVEVYGASKDGVGWNHLGQRAGRPLLATWAEAGVAIAAQLLAGDQDPRPHAPGLLHRALAGLPPGLGRPRLRADSGFFDQHLARAALAAGCDFAICARRNPALWQAVRAVPADAWRAAVGMPAAEVATCAYRPQGWPPATRAVVRRVALDASKVSADPRSRRWRTVDPQQLAAARAGKLDRVYGYTVILTSLPDDPAAIEAWFRHRADIEDRIRDAKLGYALRHLPSATVAVNRVWLWAALLALNLSAWTQALGLGASSRAHAKRLRRELVCVPGRLIRHARRLVLHLSPRSRHLVAAYARLRALPSPTG
jgi:Transposase DDE domain group 1